MKIINKGYIISFIIGVVISSGVIYAATLLASDVTYDNTTSGMNANNVQGAIDELYTKANNPEIPSNYKDLTTPVNVLHLVY